MRKVSNSAEDEHYLAQLQSLQDFPFELEDRQLEIISIFPNASYAYSFTKEADEIVKTQRFQLDAEETTHLHTYYSVHTVVDTGFTVILIGKDGTVKRRSNEVLDAWEFFDQIDTMPMRQREMSK